MSAAHLLIAAAGGLPEAENSAPAAAQQISRGSYYTTSPEQSPAGPGEHHSPARQPSPDAPATVWASAEEQRRLSARQEPAAGRASAGSGGAARTGSAAAQRLSGHSGSDDEGEGGLRLEDLLSGGTSEPRVPTLCPDKFFKQVTCCPRKQTFGQFRFGMPISSDLLAPCWHLGVYQHAAGIAHTCQNCC